MTLSLTERFAETRRFLQRRRWAAALLYSFVAALTLLLVASLAAFARPMQEQTAFLLVAGAAVAWIAFVSFISARIWLKPAPLPQLAAQVEHLDPRWMDGLICAVELEQKPAQERRSLEQTLIEQMRRETRGIDFRRTLIRRHWQKQTLLVALGAAILLALLLGFTPFFSKARYFFVDLVTRESSGLIVRPGNGEAPVRSDVRVQAEVRRWEDRPVIEYIDEHGRHRFPMHQQETGHSFTFYDLGHVIRYRVITPSLRSTWYRLSSYIPPSIDEVEITIVPPAYTRLPEETFSELRDLAAVQGSRIQWQIRSSGAVASVLQANDTAHTMEAPETDRFSYSIVAQQSFSGRFVVTDGEGRPARTPPFQVQVKPDQPPTIEVTQPGRDTEAPPAGQVDLRALAADDFGLTGARLHVSVSGRRQPPLSLFNSTEAGPDVEPVLERTLGTALDLAALEAQEGDVITYFFTATDNREPERQQARSEVYFIEVRDEVDPMEMEGEPMELDQIDLQALIVEMKRLIRLSWEAIARNDPRLEREIAAGLEEVRLETARVQQEVINQAGPEEGAALAALLGRAMERMEAAVEQIGQREVEPSIPFQEMALADLVAIQTELMKNQPQSQEPSENGSSGPSGQQQETVEDEHLEALQELMRQVQRMADEQGAQSSSLRRLSSLTEEQQAEMQRRQDALRQQAQQAQQALDQVPGLEGVQRDLASAGASMQNASEQIAGNQPGGAARDGDRARASLLSAMDRLDDAISQASGNQVAQLARQAQEMAQQQGQAAGGSRGLAESDSPSSEEIAALRQQQQGLQEGLQSLLNSMDQAAGQLRDSSPEAARAVAEAGQQMRDQNLAGQMGRAGNALLYRRFDRAAEMQDQAAEQLGGLAQSLQESASLMPSMSRQQMEQLLSQLQQAQQEVMGMAGQAPDEIAGRLDQMSGRLGERVGRAGQALQNQSLQEISGELRGASGGDGQPPNLFRMDNLLRAASRSLEQQLFALEMDRRSRLQRQVAEPPEKYRGLVEEYFRSLSDTP
jgi:hypothetical protein